MWSYPVLDPVSQAYPEAEGRSPTCYSPVRRSCTPERALPLDLHVLSTPPAFVLSQDQTLHRNLNSKINKHNWHKQTRKIKAQHTVEFSKDIHTPSHPAVKRNVPGLSHHCTPSRSWRIQGGCVRDAVQRTGLIVQALERSWSCFVRRPVDLEKVTGCPWDKSNRGYKKCAHQRIWR